MLDAVIVGGGPAGLFTALTLGHAQKRVLLGDSGAPRNARAQQLDNFVTCDGTPPAEFRSIAREAGFVVVDPSTKQTSIPGLYAAGDPTTRLQAAVSAAAAGMQAAAALNHELPCELVRIGEL